MHELWYFSKTRVPLMTPLDLHPMMNLGTPPQTMGTEQYSVKQAQNLPYPYHYHYSVEKSVEVIFGLTLSSFK